jgi:hypothetical protein
VERPSRGKKSTTQEQFEKLLQKKCPWCVNSKHAAIDCFQLKRTFGSPGNGKKNKSTGKEPEDEEQEDKSETPKFQDASKTVNVIFGGDEDFCSKREQKLLRQEILSIEPAIPRPLRWSEVPISFSRADQWTSFSEPGKFPLVLDPVVAEVKITQVLIDGGSGLNLIFASTLKKMGLDLTNKLTPSKLLFTVLSLAMLRTRLEQLFSQSLSGRGRITEPSSSSSRWLTSNRIFLPCYTGEAGARQVHGGAALCLLTSQDARTQRRSHAPRRLEEVL